MLDHITIRTTRIEENRRFFEELLGLTVGYRPPIQVPGYWLYDGPNPIVHLVPASGPDVDRTSEGYDHIAFRLPDYEGTIRRLNEMGVKFSEYKLAELGEHRVFIKTPTGISIELCFGGYVPAEN